MAQSEPKLFQAELAKMHRIFRDLARNVCLEDMGANDLGMAPELFAKVVAEANDIIAKLKHENMVLQAKLQEHREC